MSDSKYLFVPNDQTHTRIKQMVRDMGLPDDYWKFLIGEKKNGHINGKDITNNNHTVQRGEYTMYEFDLNIVAELDAAIIEEKKKYADVLWLSHEEAIELVNQIGGV